MNYVLIKLLLEYIKLKNHPITNHESFKTLAQMEKRMKQLAKALDRQTEL